MIDSVLAYLGFDPIIAGLRWLVWPMGFSGPAAAGRCDQAARPIPDRDAMETPLSPLEFARRARKLYPEREAVVDGDRRLNYEEFFDRCDRWSAALQTLGVQQGDRVAYIAPNTLAQLESFYAVPQIGAVLVPLNYRLIADDFAYLINHSGARIVCVHSDYLEAVESIRAQLPMCRPSSRSKEARPAGWITRRCWRKRTRDFRRPAILETDLLTINYTSGTTSRPKGVMITHRNAYMNVVGTLAASSDDHGGSLSLDAADVSRQRLDFCLDCHRRRRGSRLPAKGRAAGGFREDRNGIGDHALRRADGLDQHRPCAGGTPSRSASWCSRSDRRSASRCGHDRANRGRTRLGDHPSLRAD